MDFVFGIGLYLSPSDMELHPGNNQGYNNEVIIAGSDAAVGHNPGMNESQPVVPTARSAGKVAPPAGTVHRGPAVPPTAQSSSLAAAALTKSLEFDLVNLPDLARMTGNQYEGELAILYDRVLRYRRVTKDKSDTLWNFDINVNARSMTVVLMLFFFPCNNPLLAIPRPSTTRN